MALGAAMWRFPGSFLFSGKGESIRNENLVLRETEIQPTVVSEEKAGIEQEQPAQDTTPAIGQGPTLGGSSLIENVPFTVQAPFGEWNIATFQNGCEEAALTMAAYWVSGKPLTKEIAKKEILVLASFENKKHGQSVDTSAKDTEKLFKEYYNITTTEVHTDIVMTDIEETLASGAIVIVPADGRKLQNPNYKQPGPTTHMLVVIGYDAKKKEFITNDSGTRKGKGYRYKENILYEAIRDYPTGDHLSINGIKKNMIVVRKP